MAVLPFSSQWQRFYFQNNVAQSSTWIPSASEKKPDVEEDPEDHMLTRMWTLSCFPKTNKHRLSCDLLGVGDQTAASCGKESLFFPARTDG